jgi:hypothetical protein
MKTFMEKIITVYDVLEERGHKNVHVEHFEEINRLVSEAYKNKTGAFSTHLVEKNMGQRFMLVKGYPIDFHLEIHHISEQYFKLVSMGN